MQSAFALFDPSVRVLWCFAHRIHLVICNGLGLWKKFRKTSDQADTSEELSQTIKKMSINLDETEERSEEEDKVATDEESNSEGSELQCLI
jgi:hypothetical protein